MPPDKFDEYGFEKREVQKAYLPLFIPFSELLVNDEKLRALSIIGDVAMK